MVEKEPFGTPETAAAKGSFSWAAEAVFAAAGVALPIQPDLKELLLLASIDEADGDSSDGVRMHINRKLWKTA